MAATVAPRVVLAYRASEWELLVAKHGTSGQARFFLDSRGQDIDEVKRRHLVQIEAMQEIENSVPRAWRRARVARADLPHFLFEPEDIVIAVGQDGLVPNLAKYIACQPVVGVNPDPGRYEGTLVRTSASAMTDLLPAVAASEVPVEERTMVEARVDDGQVLIALNEIYVGHETHQSARYQLRCEHGQERQSSSGVIITTGTGASGWARSINRERDSSLQLPSPIEQQLAFLVREAWPSVGSETAYTEGLIESGSNLTIVSEMEQGGVVFGDGLESDRLLLRWGQEVNVGVAGQTLRLVAA